MSNQAQHIMYKTKLMELEESLEYKYMAIRLLERAIQYQEEALAAEDNLRPIGEFNPLEGINDRIKSIGSLQAELFVRKTSAHAVEHNIKCITEDQDNEKRTTATICPTSP